jgi:hypothetical protein
MPSVLFDLGKYVTVRPRADGTSRVLFEVPKRLRPFGWSAVIPLPRSTERPDGTYVERLGRLTDELELKAIREDAAALFVELRQARTGAGPIVQAEKRNFAALNRSWQQSQRFKAKKPRTQKGYAYYAGVIAEWAEAAGDKPVSGLTYERAEQFLALYDDRPTDRRHLKIVLNMLMKHAKKLGWRADNPVEDISMSAPVAKLKIWTREQVMAGAWACIMSGQSSLAALMLAEWEIGQRLTDVRMFRRGGEYLADEGVFRFWQSKTSSYITVPVSSDLRALLDILQDEGSLYLFVDRATGKPFAEQRLGHVWAAIREAFGFDPGLQIRTLRHSCVVQLALAGVDIPGICSITGHALKSAHQILEKYLPKDSRLAWAAQVARGIIPAGSEPPDPRIGHNSRGAMA